MDVKPVTFDERAMYTPEQVSEMLDISGSVLAQARRTGALKYIPLDRRGVHVLYTGTALMAWLAGLEQSAAPSP